eukprot:TRINITY_DN25317_c0_g1_i1.p1 TRINITY_DN25317_c0_g1~~TRINITY_DN25317_c0_g1_i1.p1  ORF type:complete len:1227 (-),score=332.98 TRINITY_DN25317_c0_g1_i1:209-3592(-)
MSQVGSHTFDMVPGQDVYEVPIKPNPGVGVEGDVKLKFQIREAVAASAEAASAAAAATEEGSSPADETAGQGSPSKKLQSALMMRSYLDNHDVLRQMQELLQDMVSQRPEDPIDYMIQRLEEICRDSQAVDYDLIDGNVSGTVVDVATTDPKPDKPPEPEKKEEPKAEKEEKSGDDSESESDNDDDGEDIPPPPPPQSRQKRCSVSEEAYGQFNQRKAYEPKVIAKDDATKERLKMIMQQCWMFREQSPENMKIIIDALEEKHVEPGTRCVQQGDSGNVMWIIEEGELECFKKIEGVEKSVKICKRGDVFGELALLYGCPRAASVDAKAKCTLWELDRETFKAICYEAASKAPAPAYEGFHAPGAGGGDSSPKDPHPPESENKSFNRQKTRRREGVSAEALSADDGTWTPPVHEKSAEEREQLSTIIRTSRDGKLHMLFGTVSDAIFEKIVDAMFAKSFKAGEHAIEQGAVGDYFYIVKSGEFDIFVKKGDEPNKKVFTAGVGFAFGELALLYNAPRSATITAVADAEVWCLDRTAFRNLVVRSAEAQFKEYVSFINLVDLFSGLDEHERASLAEVFDEEVFEDDEAIVEQDDRDDKMFILRSGQAVACLRGDKGEVEVMQYKEKDYFGEIALLSGEPRKASVYAVGKCRCLYITRATFQRILGPLGGILQKNMDKYAKYQDAIASEDTSAVQDQQDADHHDGDEHEGMNVLEQKKKVVGRKRERKSDDLANVDTHKVVAEMKSDDTPPETLADKVAKDFENKALVDPCEKFVDNDAQFTMYGGVIPRQKFTMNKHIYGPIKIPKKAVGDDDGYSWQAPSKLKSLTDIAVICQKGQKSAADPTPNQDNFFVKHIGAVTMYGVCDGHGPFGHLVSLRLVQSLPHFLQKSEHFGKDWEQCLKQGFLDAQKELEEFCKEQNINIEASGAAGSVMIQEEQTVHIAFIGDARIMLASWNRRDSRLIHCTKDHKPDLPEEKARLEAAGSEVREIDPGNHRIYLPGSNFPGLTMSRAFGDTACAGVLREPEYTKFLMQPTDQWFAIVASDGIWEFMEGEEVCNLSAKKLRLKGPRETVQFLVNASRKRWAHVCGDYCDDITAILVQWNSAEAPLEADTNCQLVVKRVDNPAAEA